MIVEDESMPLVRYRPPARRVQLKSDAAPSSAFLMRKWIGEHDDRLDGRWAFRANLKVSRNLSPACGQ